MPKLSKSTGRCSATKLRVLVEPLVLDLFYCALAFAQILAALFFVAPESYSVLGRACFALGAFPLFAILIEVDNHPRTTPPSTAAPHHAIGRRLGAIAISHDSLLLIKR